jgi:hypothetical protein
VSTAKEKKGPRLDVATMGDADLARLGWRLPRSIDRHKATLAATGSEEAARKLQSTAHLFAQVRAEMDKRQGAKGTVTLIDVRSERGQNGLCPFEAFAAVARGVLPCELYGRIAREANALLGDDASPEDCSALLRVKPRKAEAL